MIVYSRRCEHSRDIQKKIIAFFDKHMKRSPGKAEQAGAEVYTKA
jgi:hypothetical protein